MQSYKQENPIIHQTKLPDLTEDEIELVNAWHEVAMQRMDDEKRGRIERREERIGRTWPGVDAETWRARAMDSRAAHFCLKIGSGITTTDALAACGYEKWTDWLTWSGPTSWQCVYTIARETAIELLTEQAQDRLLKNVANGEDGGFKSATYILDWWRQCHGMSAADHANKQLQLGNRAADGITYNIAVFNGDESLKMCGKCDAKEEITIIPQ